MPVYRIAGLIGISIRPASPSLIVAFLLALELAASRLRWFSISADWMPTEYLSDANPKGVWGFGRFLVVPGSRPRDMDGGSPIRSLGNTGPISSAPAACFPAWRFEYARSVSG